MSQTSSMLEKHEKNPAPSGPLIFPGNYPDSLHQHASQQSTCRPLWYQENTRICSPEIELANASLWCWRLCEEMQCMPGLKSNLTQTIWWFTIFTCTFLSTIRKFFWWILLGVCQFQWIEKETTLTQSLSLLIGS